MYAFVVYTHTHTHTHTYAERDHLLHSTMLAQYTHTATVHPVIPPVSTEPAYIVL